MIDTVASTPGLGVDYLCYRWHRRPHTGSPYQRRVAAGGSCRPATRRAIADNGHFRSTCARFSRTGRVAWAHQLRQPTTHQHSAFPRPGAPARVTGPASAGIRRWREGDRQPTSHKRGAYPRVLVEEERRDARRTGGGRAAPSALSRRRHRTGDSVNVLHVCPVFRVYTFGLTEPRIMATKSCR